MNKIHKVCVLDLVQVEDDLEVNIVLLDCLLTKQDPIHRLY